MAHSTILAKPSGVTYSKHVKNVHDQAEIYLSSREYVIGRFKSRFGENLSEWLRLAVKYHDVGKRDPRWQQACYQDYLVYKALKDNEKFRGENLRKLGQKYLRHELLPLKQLSEQLKLPEEVLVAIAAHHGKYSQSANDEDRFKASNALGLWGWWKKLSNKFALREWTEKSLFEALELNLRFSGPRSILQLADHRASAAEPPENIELPKFEKYDYVFCEDWEKREVQRIAEENWKEQLLLLRAPTGSGKTDASLLWAKKQIGNERADRCVICMPTRFTSNALEVGVANQLSATGLYHSTAWFSKYSNAQNKSKKSQQTEKQKFSFARTLESPLTVCTIDHLLMSLTQSREDHHGILFNLSHSCVVIDEADFYDEFTQANIQILLKVLRYFKVPLLVMSATLPESSLSLYKSVGYTSPTIKEDATKNDEKRCEILKCIEYEDPDEVSDLLHKCTRQPSIIYANTVDKALEFFEWFNNKNIEDVTLYHSRFVEPDKVQKEEELVNKLGKNAWKEGKAHGIAILTQIGELSINISADLMLTDLAPGDRLVQRLGRLSRFKDDYGSVYLLIPKKYNSLYPAPYGEFVNRKWKASPYLLKTREIFKEGKYSAGDFVRLVDSVYPESVYFSEPAKNNAQMLVKNLLWNWLMLPAAITSEDDESTGNWKSRNIPPTIDIFVKELPENFSSYSQYQEQKITSAITLPSYIVHKAKKENLITEHKVLIGDTEHKINFDSIGVYSYDTGFVISKRGYADNFL